MARDFFQRTLGLSEGPSSTLTTLAGVEVRVYYSGTVTPAPIYGSSGGSEQLSNPIITAADGLVEFWAEVGAYDINVMDAQAPPRVAQKTFGWNAVPAVTGGLPTALLADDGGIDIAKLTQIVAESLVPPGTLAPYAGTTAPDGWALCDGTEAPADATGVIAALAGNPYGTGANGRPLLPDMRGRIAVSKGTHVDVDTLGENEGLSLNSRRPSHDHQLPNHTHAAGSYTAATHSHQHISPVGLRSGTIRVVPNWDGTRDWNGSSYDYLDAPGDNGYELPAGSGNVSERWVVTSTAATPAVSGTSGNPNSLPQTDAGRPAYLVTNYIIKL